MPEPSISRRFPGSQKIHRHLQALTLSSRCHPVVIERRHETDRGCWRPQDGSASRSAGRFTRGVPLDSDEQQPRPQERNDRVSAHGRDASGFRSRQTGESLASFPDIDGSRLHRRRCNCARHRGRHLWRRRDLPLADLCEMGRRLQEGDRDRTELSVDRLRRRHQADPEQDGDVRRQRRAAQGRPAREGRPHSVPHGHGWHRAGHQCRGHQAG